MSESENGEFLTQKDAAKILLTDPHIISIEYPHKVWPQEKDQFPDLGDNSELIETFGHIGTFLNEPYIEDDFQTKEERIVWKNKLREEIPDKDTWQAVSDLLNHNKYAGLSQAGALLNALNEDIEEGLGQTPPKVVLDAREIYLEANTSDYDRISTEKKHERVEQLCQKMEDILEYYGITSDGKN